MMYHPMHLHGHFMLVHGSAGGVAAPLVKDTVLVPPGHMMRPSRLDVDWLADNPGNWPYHCHQIYHMAAGMMRLVEYVSRDGDADGLTDGQDYSPDSAYPVTWTLGRGGGLSGRHADPDGRPMEAGGVDVLVRGHPPDPERALGGAR